VQGLIPADLVSKLNTLGDYLRSNILGQDEVLNDIVSLLRRSFCKIRFAGRPVASMLFLGGTGTGKTESSLLFTRHLFGSEEKLVRLDMSEFMNRNAVGVLIGERVGERGLFGHYYDRSKGCGTLLFDEIEKAEDRVLDIFLQILSAGRFTLANGETLDLSNYVVVATSNIGSRMLMESRSTDRETLTRRTLQSATQDIRPETYGRFDLQCVFNKLDYQTLQRVAELHLGKCLEVINSQGHSITCEDGVLDHVRREGYSERFGARPMQNAAMRVLGEIVAAQMLRNGGLPVCGAVGYDRKTNKCFFVP
jgi:ATP-dependent Clp protease ATP-binding subunit ClpB